MGSSGGSVHPSDNTQPEKFYLLGLEEMDLQLRTLVATAEIWVQFPEYT